ncbi:DNA-binding protein [Marilutibacter chinensis]|uniref:DNA-binding protein n=1 Tax=Marilutibacter chinensis TaxID=2912247 RepID=A0ABS9HS57_9GAMM|nr:DNA-binding protein [Lysobacter chinensis]MCF7221503.1 DNA-binding protein [Lysobacter chinensis]
MQQDITELFREPGQTYLSPARFATTLELDLSVLANALGVHRNTMRLHPESPRTQERMRDYNRVFLALLGLKPNVRDAAFHMKNTPVRVLGQRTLFDAVKDGDTDKALRYLQSISGGQNG